MSKLIDTIAEAIQDKKGKNIISLDLSIPWIYGFS